MWMQLGIDSIGLSQYQKRPKPWKGSGDQQTRQQSKSKWLKPGIKENRTVIHEQMSLAVSQMTHNTRQPCSVWFLDGINLKCSNNRSINRFSDNGDQCQTHRMQRFSSNCWNSWREKKKANLIDICKMSCPLSSATLKICPLISPLFCYISKAVRVVCMTCLTFHTPLFRLNK